MNSISIIGLGGMARALGTRVVESGHAVEVIGRDAAKAEELAVTLGNGATAGIFGAVPTGDLVVLAVPSASAAAIVTHYGNALDGKVIIDITNPVNADATGLTATESIAKVAPVNAPVVKAFNTVFGHVLAPGRSLDVLFAGDDAEAKAKVSAFIESLGLRPLDAGGLEMAHWLEGTGLLMINLARNGAGTFDFALGITVFS